jgi:hypothetical protein
MPASFSSVTVSVAGVRTGKCFTVPGLVHPKRPAAEFLTVKIGNRGIGVFHVDKSETTRTVPFSVRDYFSGPNASDRLKEILQGGFGGIMGKVAYKHLFYHKSLLITVFSTIKACS